MAKLNIIDLTNQTVPRGQVHEKGTFLQRSGVNLFYAVLSLTTLILIGLFLYLFIMTPSYSPTAYLDTNTNQGLIQERHVVFSNFTSGIEKIIIAFCLPILTAILGYLFGTREENHKSSAE